MAANNLLLMQEEYTSQIRDNNCHKRKFGSRKQARKSQKTLPGESLHTYRCSLCNKYHLGHIPKKVKTGEVDSYNFYSWNEEYRPHNSTKRAPRCILEFISQLEASGEIDELGLLIANIIASHYRLNDISPTWREVFSKLPDTVQAQLFTPSNEWTGSKYYWCECVKKTVMEKLRARRWVKFDGTEKSLQCGRKAWGD